MSVIVTTEQEAIVIVARETLRAVASHVNVLPIIPIADLAGEWVAGGEDGPGGGLT
jgi:hypothetical protein